jgi:hypothetical protein
MDNPFGTGTPPVSGPFEAGMLPRAQKEQLCRDLLVEFGAERISVGGRERDELVHGCLVTAYHRDQRRSPTAALNFDKLTYNCFGCGASGGLLWLIATCRKSTSEQALGWLSKQTGTGGHTTDAETLLAFLEAVFADKAKPPPIPTYSPRVLEPWLAIHPYLTDGAPDLGLKGRYLPETTIERFKLGWDPEADRIVLPHFWKGKLVGWQTRRIWSDGSPKYLSSPDFPKDRTIFNADDPMIAKHGYAVVVESMMTVYAHAHEWPVVATFGAELTEAQLRLLQGLPAVITFFDNDEAGWKATELVRDQLDGRGPLVYCVESPYTKRTDGGDLSTDEFGMMVDQSVYGSTWQRPDELDLIEYQEAA